MPAETAQKSRPMCILGFVMPFLVYWSTYMVILNMQDLFGKNTECVLIDVSCWALPLLSIGTLIYSFAKGSRSFGKGLLAAPVACVLFIGGFILIIYLEYGM